MLNINWLVKLQYGLKKLVGITDSSLTFCPMIS